MKQYQIPAVVLGPLLLTASAGRADTITAFLDNPSNETDHDEDMSADDEHGTGSS